MVTFKRNCPSCKKEMIYCSKYSLDRAEKKNKSCRSCCTSAYLIKKSQLIDRTPKFRKCPDCNKDIQIRHDTDFQNPRSCKSCSTSKTLKKAWQDPERTIGSKLYTGYCKKFSYYSPSAGNVSLDGTWELKVAQYLDNEGLHWKRNTKRFPYFFNGDHSYVPDFFIEEWNAYLEIKGIETEADKQKWNQFPESLIVWKKSDLLSKGIHVS